MLKQQQKKGSSLILTLIVIGIGLGISLELAFVFIKELQFSRNISFSTIAICAADAGVEKALFNQRINNDFSDIPSTSLPLVPDASFKVNVCCSSTPCSSALNNCVKIKSQGFYKGVLRTVEARYGYDDCSSLAIPSCL